MDFKALSRTAEADVPAFASAAPQRLVRSRFASVKIAEDRRLRSHLCSVSASSTLTTKAWAQVDSPRLNPKKIYPLQSPTKDLGCTQGFVPWISEEERSSRTSTTTGQCGLAEETSEESVRLGERGEAATNHRTARMFTTPFAVNPGSSKRPVPHPTGDRSQYASQPQRPSHAIHPAAGNHT